MKKADDETLSEVGVELRRIRDRILSLQTIWIQLDSEDDAYVIFETMNSRGKDLEVVDLLKNLLLQDIRAENGDLDTARQTSAEMRSELADKGGQANANKFILHWWLSQKEYVAERKLFKLLKKRFAKGDAKTYLRHLQYDSRLYARLANPRGVPWKHYETDLWDALDALNIFNVRQPRPLLLAVLGIRKRFNKI